MLNFEDLKKEKMLEGISDDDLRVMVRIFEGICKMTDEYDRKALLDDNISKLSESGLKKLSAVIGYEMRIRHNLKAR
jgi:hypothetical protein